MSEEPGAAAPQSLERRLERLELLLRCYRCALLIAGLVIALLIALLFYAKAPAMGRAILIDGKPIVLVRNERAAAAVRQRLLAAAGGGEGRATFRERWEEASRPTEGEPVLSVAEAVRVLRDRVTVVKEAFAIEAQGRRLVIVPTREQALAALDRLKAKYAAPTDAVVRSVTIKPTPAIRPCAALPAEIVADVEEAARRLREGRVVQTYVIQRGDYPERIATAHGMTLEQFWALNPTQRGRPLRVGEAVHVLGKQSGLTVVTVKETVTTVTLAPGVRYERTSRLRRGEQRVVAPGQTGYKRVRWEITMHNEREIARRPLGEQIVVPPQPKIIAIGTTEGTKTP